MRPNTITGSPNSISKSKKFPLLLSLFSKARSKSKKSFWLLPCLFGLGLMCCDASNSKKNGELVAGFSAVSVTPLGFEGFDDVNQNGWIDNGEKYLDTGIDGIFNIDEPGYDADTNPDPNQDDFDATTNPTGTENDLVWQRVIIAGYGGFFDGELRAAQGVHDDIWARAIYTQEGSNQMLLIATDFVGLMSIHTDPLKTRIESELGIPFNNIITMANHNHQAPDVVGVWAGERNPDYMSFVQEQMFQSAKLAFEQKQPAKVRSGSAEPISCYDPNNFVLKKDADCNHPDYAYGFDLDESSDKFLLQRDSRDPIIRNTKVTAMEFVHAQTGAPLGNIVNFSDHPEALGSNNGMISSDFPHYVREMMERERGGVSIYISGTTGAQIGIGSGHTPLYDASGQMVLEEKIVNGKTIEFPILIRTEDRAPKNPQVELIRSMGYAVALAAIEAIENQEFTVKPGVFIDTQEVFIPMDNGTYKLLLGLVSSGDDYDEALGATTIFEHTHCGNEKSDVGTCARAQISWAGIGEIQFITAPGEISPEYLLGRPAITAKYKDASDLEFAALPAIRDYLSSRDVMVVGIAQQYLGYMIPHGDYLYDADHPNYYEDLVSAGVRYGDTVGNKLLQMLGSTETFSDHVKIFPE